MSRFSIRRTPSRHWAGFFVLSGILFASVAISPFYKEPFSLCLIKDVFGFPCPGCGLTRAVLFLAHGDFRSALELNMNSLLVFCLLILFWLCMAFNVATHNEIKIQFSRLESFFLILVSVALTATGWIYNLQGNPWI